MTLAEAISQVEAMFIMHDEIGLPQTYTNQDGVFVADGPRDMMLAPCGEPYEIVSSFGVNEALSTAPVMFASQGLAVQWWFDEVQDWKRETAATHLYWRKKPEFVSATYLLMDQGAAMRTDSPLAELPQVDLGFVTARMLISKLGPDGREG
jgi:hypothetical protein